MNKFSTPLKGFAAIFLLFVLGLTHAISQTTNTFNFTGGPQNFVVPPCVTSVTIVAEGAQGGSISGATGGLGAVLTFTIAVVPGQIIGMDIGGQGGCPTPGYNGGGLGYNTTSGSAGYSSCGGGGATEITVGGVLIAVAAGGGGAGGGSISYNGGGGGGCANGIAGVNTYGAGGGGGSQVAGGNGGAPWAGVPPGGQNGSLGQGGNGGFWQTASGGGGGGGYYGGGGGGNDGCCTGANGGGGGGGGSSLTPGGGGCAQGSNTGPGTVSITYTLASPVMTSPNTATICGNGTVNIPLTATFPSNFTWVAAANPNVGGESTTVQNTATLNNTLTNTTTVAQVVVYTVTPTANPGGCVGTPQIVNVTVNPAPTMTSTNVATICSATAVNIPLTANMASNFTWIAADNLNVTGESTTLQASATLNNTLTNTSTTPQIVTYTVTPTSTPGACIGTPQIVNVTVNPTPSVTALMDQLLCANTMTAAVNYVGPVVGTIYNWTNNQTSIGLAANGVGNIPAFNAVNIGTVAVTSIITITPTGPAPSSCVGLPQTFTITVNPIPTVVDPADQLLCAGTNTTAVNFTGAVAGTTFDWTNNQTSIGLAANGIGNIGSFVGINAGVVAVVSTVTVTPTASTCVGTPQTFTYTVNPNLVAGADNSASICNSPGSTIDLDGLLAGNNTTGVWAETTGSGQFNTGTGVFTGAGLVAANYSFTYTVTGMAPCLNDVANFTVSISDLPNAGADNSSTQCNSAGTTLDLNLLLVGADLGGTWAETTGSGQFNTVTGVFTVAGVPAGVYTFTYNLAAIGPCPGDQAVFTITVNQYADAGLDAAPFVLCNLPGSFYDINTALSGNNAVGVWLETSAIPSGQFNAGTGMFDASGLSPTVYNFSYTVSAVAPCVQDVANFILTVEQDAEAGLDNTANLCNAPGVNLDLNTLVNGNNAPGNWVETSGSGQFNTVSGVFDASGLAAGNYTFTYTVVATLPCVNDVADFTITVEQEALAGLDNTSNLCNIAGTTLNLNTLLNGNNAVGTWAETSGSGQFTPGTGIFDASGLAPGVYNFTYTVAAVAPCVQDVANFAITVEQEAIAGANNTASLCNAPGNTINLNTLLAGNNAVGIWAETSASGQFNAGTGILNAAGLPAGNYTFTYTVSAVAPCAQDIANFTITVEQEALAGLDNSASLCNTAGTTLNLNTLLNGNNAVGVWAETTGSGQFNAGTGTLNAAGIPAGNYTFTYTVSAVAPCVADVADFTITIQQEVTAGADDNAALCNTLGNTINVNTLLSGNDPGGVWAETSASGQFNSGTGLFDASGLNGGAYNFTYSVAAIAPCVLDVSNFTVNVNEIPVINAGLDQAVCDGTSITLAGSGAGVGGGYLWTGGVTDLLPFNQIVGTLNYSVTGTDINGCSNSDNVDVTVNPLPAVSFVADTLMGCIPFDVTFQNLSAPLGNNCQWTFGDGSGALGCGSVDQTYLTAGTFNVSLTVTSLEGCVSSATYNNYITVAPFPVASFNYSPDQPTVEESEVHFTNASFNGDTYQWNFGDGAPNSFQMDPSHIYPQTGNVDYTVQLIVNSNAGCADTITQIVTIQDVLIFYVPNVFTPDDDVNNNVFLPVFTSGFDIYDYHFTIYNRWGEILFESYNATVGWDGTYGDRGLAEDGVYIWQIEFGDNVSDRRHKHNGHVTVLK